MIKEKKGSIIITGGLSGIGLELVKILLKNSSSIDIIITTVKYKEIEDDTLKQILELDRVKLLELDLLSDESIDQFLKEIKIQCKTINSLILNAGYIKTSPCLMTSEESLEMHMRINYFSNIRIIQYVIRKYMLRQGKGSIVNISSSAAKFANEGRLAYGASKSAMSLAMRVMSRELAKKNILFNSILPGLTETNLMRASTKEDDINDYLMRVDNKRLSHPIEIAYLIDFLISDFNTHITGQEISIDGGI